MSDICFGAIADDFTGATHLASALSRTGVPVTLRIGLPDPGERAPATAFEVIALRIRTAPPEDAVAEARAALRWLRARGARRIFWAYRPTFDSTSRGNIGPVADALMSDLGIDRTVHCPASPATGQRVFMGRLFVGDVPLNESAMKDHPLTPMRDANLMRLLTPQVRRQVGLVSFPTVRAGADAVRDALERLAGHVVLDAVEDVDLAMLAEAVHDLTLLCGATAIAERMPAIWARAGMSAASAPLPCPGAGTGRIVLSGSCSAMARAQVGAYLNHAVGYRIDPLELAQGGLKDVRAWLAVQKPDAPKIVFATAEPKAVAAAREALGVARAGALVEDALAQLAMDARRMGIGRIVVAGGRTGAAVIRALDVDRLRIGPQIAPDVPWCLAEDGTALALMSGDAGTAGIFSDAFGMLEKEAAVAAG